MIFKALFFILKLVSVRGYVHVCAGAIRGERYQILPGIGDTPICELLDELLDACARNQTRILWMTKPTL